MNYEVDPLINPESLSNQKPTVVYLQTTDGRDSKSEENTMVDFLEQNFGFQVITDIHGQEKEIQFLLSSGRSAGFLVKETLEDKYEPSFPKDTVERLRRINQTAPIIFIPYRDISNYDSLSSYNSVFVAQKGEKEVFRLFRKYIKKFTPRPAYFGVETTDDIEPMTELVLRSYQNSDHDHGAASSNDQTVIQATRIRVTPTEFISSVFEDNLARGDWDDFNLMKDFLDQETIKKEKELIRNFSDDERKRFVSTVLYDAKHYNEKGEYRRTVRGMGSDTRGFAIDPETMKYILTGYAQHAQTKNLLAQQIMDLLTLSGDENAEEAEAAIQWNFISGFIFPYVPGFSSSILIFDYDTHFEWFPKIVEFLNKQNFIAVTKSGRLIE